VSHCTEHRHFAYQVHDMDVLSTGGRIERKTCIRVTRMIEPTRVREYSSTSIHLHAIRLENADQTRFFACPRDGFVDAAGPAFGILAMAGVESVVLRLLVWRQLCKRFLNVGEHVVGDGDDEERGVGEDAGAAGEVAQCEAAVTFVGDCADGIVWIAC
jgi:hypothetical protein